MKQFLVIAYTAIFPLVFGFMHRPAEMALAAASGCLLFAIVNLEKFESFKGAGFEAKLNKAVNDAYATIDRLQEIAIALTEPIVSSITMHKRMLQYIPMKYRIEQIKDIEKSLISLGIAEDRVNKATEFFYSVIEQDHIKQIFYAILKEEGAPTALKESAKRMTESFPDDFDFHEFMAKQDWKATGETAERIADLEFFKSKRTFRRIDIWQ